MDIHLNQYHTKMFFARLDFGETLTVNVENMNHFVQL